MNFLIKRHSLYPLLQKVVNIIGNRPRLPILNHILLEIDKNYLFITATNLEVEIVARVLLDKEYPSGSITISGRKFFEICRNLPKHVNILITLKDNKIFVNSGCSSFSLSTLAVSNFPKIKEWKDVAHITISQSTFKKMIKLTQFAMAYQDARYYLNGMLFETDKNTIRMVATDGYRLAMSETIVDLLLPSKSVIIPRKGILEILHLLNIEPELINIQMHDNCICMRIGNYTVSSKLIDAIFPNYQSVFPKQSKNIFEIERSVLKEALQRASILSNEKLRVVNLNLTINQLKISTCNFEQETSEEILKILYSNESLQISFNIDYLLDVINAIDSQILKFFLTNEISSVQIEGIPKCHGATYIVMPIRI